jgi:beta-lactamase superfamily II metal-dependent hydrolase
MWDANQQRNVIVVVDAGYQEFGTQLADNVFGAYGTRDIDLAISTHPDGDHINGLENLINSANVKELLLHRPSLRGYSSDQVASDSAEKLYQTAVARGVIVTNPDQGLTRFGGLITILGPSEDFYLEMLTKQLSETYRSKVVAAVFGATRSLAEKLASRFRKVVPNDPGETLADDDGGTSARNNTSVITLVNSDQRLSLLTGDAGVPAITHALDYLDQFDVFPATLRFVQMPHHGSRHNVSVDLLNRLLGEPILTDQPTRWAFASASEKDDDHPHPVVLNAFQRRGCLVRATEGNDIRHHFKAPPRAGRTKLESLPWYDEDVD